MDRVSILRKKNDAVNIGKKSEYYQEALESQEIKEVLN
jgi:hypothetical protein